MKCTAEDHQALKADASRFLAGTEKWWEVDDGVDRLICGLCRECLSSVAYRVGDSKFRGEE